jgi:hypothetical protein
VPPVRPGVHEGRIVTASASAFVMGMSWMETRNVTDGRESRLVCAAVSTVVRAPLGTHLQVGRARYHGMALPLER